MTRRQPERTGARRRASAKPAEAGRPRRRASAAAGPAVGPAAGAAVGAVAAPRAASASGRVRLLPSQWRALAAPARQEIVDVLESAGPCAVARLAELLGRPADALYHHLRRLQRVGLVLETGRARQGRHAFALYDLARRPLHVLRDTGSEDEVVALMASAQRLAWRDLRRALAEGRGTPAGPQRTVLGARVRGWLDRAALARVNALLSEALETLRSGTPGEGKVALALGVLLAPLPAHTRARPRQPAARSKPPRNNRSR